MFTIRTTWQHPATPGSGSLGLGAPRRPVDRADDGDLRRAIVRYSAEVMIEITLADRRRIPALAAVLGRSFLTEPMMTWPLHGPGDAETRLVRAFEIYLEEMAPLGILWEAGRGSGAAVWIPADERDGWRQAQLADDRTFGLTDDGGVRYEAFWTWVDAHLPAEPVWHLDSVAVDPAMRGQGIGAALINHGLRRAHAAGQSAFLETATSANITLYERMGFRVVDHATAPGGGPHVYFMRCDPRPRVGRPSRRP